MELKSFISHALQDIIGAVDDAQKSIAYGEIVPNRNAKGDVEIEFEITVKPEGAEERLVVVSAAAGGGAKPPGGPPAPGAPPSAPHAGKLKFKVPVKLPEERWYHIFYRLVNEARYCVPRRKKKAAPQSAAELANGKQEAEEKKEKAENEDRKRRE
jgi:hypothetical protein